MQHEINKTVVVIVALVAVASCRRERPPAEQQSAEQREIGRALCALVTRHGADYEWKTEGDASLFTVQVEDLLLSRIGQTLFTFASVTDVQKQEGRYLLTARDSLGVSILFLCMKCSRSQAEYVMNIPDEGAYWGSFAIVFRLDSAYHPTWELTAQPDGDTAYVEVSGPKTWFIKGECLDLLYLGQDEPEWADVRTMLNANAPD